MLLSGCPGILCDCGDPPAPTPVELAYCGLDVAVLDNGGEFAVVAEDGEVSRAAIGLEIVLRSAPELCGAPVPHDRLRDGGAPFDPSANPFAAANPFVTAAYACSCPDFGGFEASVLDTVVAISIRASGAYNDAYGPEAELGDVFRVETGYREYVTVADYLAAPTQRPLVYDEPFFGPPVGESFRLFAAETAAASEEIAFELTVTLSDGRTISGRSPAIATQ